MRDVCVFLSPQIYDDNQQMVEGLALNEIATTRFDVRDPDTTYSQAVDDYHERMSLMHIEDGSPVEKRPFLCLAFEDSRDGVRAAKAAGMCVVGIANNRIELERLQTQGAHAVALSVCDLLESFGVRNYYQVMYLPYSIHLRNITWQKAGYPVSLLDMIRGRFIKDGGDGSETEDGAVVELDPHSPRIIPREVLGIVPDSLADVYINNIGWPADGLVDSFRLNVRDVERDIVRMFGKLYRQPEGQMRGFVTSGGTEGNFTGMWWSRDLLKDKSGGHPPILLTSEQAHYSVMKAAQQLAIEGRIIQSLESGAMDCDDLACQLDAIAESEPNRPIIVVVNMGTTQTGSLDDLPRINQLLIEKVQGHGGHFAIHLDAALMGALLPIIEPFGKDVDFFRDLGVKTIAISGHKFFGSLCICGICLTTASFLEECFANRDRSLQYLTGLRDITPSGSRSGFNALSFHNTLCGLYMHTDAARLRQIIAQCYLNVEYLVKGITRVLGSNKCVLHPEHSLTVCFPRPSMTVMNQYLLMPVTLPRFHPETLYAGICVLINLDEYRINAFLKDYEQDRSCYE